MNIDSVGVPLLITGDQRAQKNTILARKISNCIEKESISASQILIFTITSSDVKSLDSSLRVALGNQMVKDMQITTFHSYCCNLLRRYGHLIQLPKDFHVISHQDTHFCLEKIISSQVSKAKAPSEVMDIDSVITAISKAKQLLQTCSIYLKEEVCTEKDLQERKKKIFLFYVYSNYEALKSQSNSLDFDDLLFKAYELLSTHPQLTNVNQRMVILDEIHNTNLLQYEIGRLFCKNLRNVVVTGNPSVSNFFLDKFVDDFKKQNILVNVTDTTRSDLNATNRSQDAEMSIETKTFLPVKIGIKNWILHTRRNENVSLATILTRKCMIGYQQHEASAIPYECVSIQNVQKADKSLIEFLDEYEHNKAKNAVNSSNETSKNTVLATLVLETSEERDDLYEKIITFREDKTMDRLAQVSADMKVILDGKTIPDQDEFHMSFRVTDGLLSSDDQFRIHIEDIANEVERSVKNISNEAEKVLVSEVKTKAPDKSSTLISVLSHAKQHRQQPEIELLYMQKLQQWRHTWYNQMEKIFDDPRTEKRRLINRKIINDLERLIKEYLQETFNDVMANDEPPSKNNKNQLQEAIQLNEEDVHNQSEEEQFAHLLVKLSKKFGDEARENHEGRRSSLEYINVSEPAIEIKEALIQQENQSVADTLEHNILTKATTCEEILQSGSPICGQEDANMDEQKINLVNNILTPERTVEERLINTNIQDIHEQVMTSPNNELAMQQMLTDLRERLFDFHRTAKSSQSSNAIVDSEEFDQFIEEMQMQLQNLRNKPSHRSNIDVSTTSFSNARDQTKSVQNTTDYDLNSNLLDTNLDKDISEVDKEQCNVIISTKHLNLNAIAPSKWKRDKDDADQVAERIFANIKSHTKTNEAFGNSLRHIAQVQTPLTKKYPKKESMLSSLSGIDMTPTKLLHVHKMLKAGHLFWRHSLSGGSKKKLRQIYLSNDSQHICVVKPDQKKKNIMGAVVEEKYDMASVQCIQRGEVVKQRRQQIKNSIGNTLLGVKKGEAKIDAECLFAIVMPNVSLDLEAKTHEEATLWADAWETVISAPSISFVTPLTSSFN